MRHPLLMLRSDDGPEMDRHGITNVIVGQLKKVLFTVKLFVSAPHIPFSLSSHVLPHHQVSLPTSFLS